MKTFNRNKPQLLLLILIPFLIFACGKSPEDARKELGQMNIEYSEASFIKCAERGDSLAVKLFLASGMDPNIKDHDGMTPLLMAVSHGREEIVSILLQNGADLNRRDKEYGFNAILFAGGSGKLNVVKLLLSKGANLTDVSKTGQTLLMRAVLIGNNVELINYLIEKKININAKDIDGNTALLHSVNPLTKNIDIVKLLLNSKADVNVADKNGDTAIMKIILLVLDQESIDIIELLLISGVNVNKSNNEGETALHKCVNLIILGLPYRVKLVDILLKYGANPNTENNKGETPVDILKNYQQEINLKYEIKHIIHNLVDKVEKVAITSPQHLVEKETIKLKYGTIKLIQKGKRVFGPKYLYLNDNVIFTANAMSICKYIKELKDDIIIIALSRGASTVNYRIITVIDHRV